MDAITLLREDHQKVKELFSEIEETEDAKKLKQTFDEIMSELAVHEKIEEQIFYPAVRGIESKKAEEMYMEALEEHHVVDLVLKELPQVDPADERFHAKMTVLSELVEHHADEEEDEMFPMAEKKLGSEELKELGARMEQMAGMAGRGRKAA